MKLGKSKSKGNKYENDLAKKLGKWIFSDKDVLQRHLTSGAQKSAYVGDIIPIKPIPWSRFPFIIECKHGYKTQIANLNNQNLLREWIIKSLNERTENQCILLLLVRFHNHSSLFITDTSLNTFCPLILNIKYEDKIIQFYIYELKELEKYNFESLYSHNDLIINEIFK